MVASVGKKKKIDENLISALLNKKYLEEYLERAVKLKNSLTQEVK